MADQPVRTTRTGPGGEEAAAASGPTVGPRQRVGAAGAGSPRAAAARRLVSGGGAELFALIALVLLCIVLAASRGTFLTEFNLQNIGRQTSVLMVASVGLLFVLLTGGIDLSIGGLIAFSGVSAAALTAHSGPVWGWILGVGIAAVVGLGNGVLVGYAAFSPIVVTLAVGQVLTGAALLLTSTGPIQPADVHFAVLATSMVGPVPVIAIAAAISALLAHFVLNRTAMGRYIYSVGGNETAAWLSGVRTARVKATAYAICGAFAGIAGVLAAARLDSGDASVGASQMLEAFAAVFLGGVGFGTARGKVGGVVCGVLILGVISNGLDLFQLDSAYQYIVSGAIIIVAIGLQVIPARLAARGR